MKTVHFRIGTGKGWGVGTRTIDSPDPIRTFLSMVSDLYGLAEGWRVASTVDPCKVTIEAIRTPHPVSKEYDPPRVYVSVFVKTGEDAHRVLDGLGDIADALGMYAEGHSFDDDPIGPLTMRLANVFGWFA